MPAGLGASHSHGAPCGSNATARHTILCHDDRRPAPTRHPPVIVYVSLAGAYSAPVSPKVEATALRAVIGWGGPKLPMTRSEEHTSELQSRGDISYAVF